MSSAPTTPGLDETPKASAPSVWVVTWHCQDTQRSGVHCVCAGETHARNLAERLTATTPRAVYKASAWFVTMEISDSYRNENYRITQGEQR